MTAPSISVLIPVYNGERYLAEAIESVLAQTHADFELIVVDDGSTDRTAEIVKRFVQLDDRVRVIRFCHNEGICSALNTGLRAARSDWIARLDADDLMLPHRLEQQLAFIKQNPDVKVVGALAWYIDENGHHRGRHTVPAPIHTRADFERHVALGKSIGLNHPSVIMHRQTILDVGGYRSDLNPAEDIDLWLRVAEAGHLILQQDDILGKYRVHTCSTTDRHCYASAITGEYVLSCARARRAGQREPTFTEFQLKLADRPLWQRVSEIRRQLGWAIYRRAGTRIENHHWVTGVAYLAAAFVLRPMYVACRLSQQLALPTRPQ